MEASAAREGRIDNDAVSTLDPGARRSADQLADHLVAHDEWVFGVDRTVVNFHVGTAEAAVGNPNEDVAGRSFGPGDFIEGQSAGSSKDHGFHKDA
jgi:hypothetical protein